MLSAVRVLLLYPERAEASILFGAYRISRWIITFSSSLLSTVWNRRRTIVGVGYRYSSVAAAELLFTDRLQIDWMEYSSVRTLVRFECYCAGIIGPNSFKWNPSGKTFSSSIASSIQRQTRWNFGGDGNRVLLHAITFLLLKMPCLLSLEGTAFALAIEGHLY